MQYINIIHISEIGFTHNNLLQVSATHISILSEAIQNIRS